MKRTVLLILTFLIAAGWHLWFAPATSDRGRAPQWDRSNLWEIRP